MSWPVRIATLSKGVGVAMPAWLQPAVDRMSPAPSATDRNRIARLGQAVPNTKLDLFHRLNAEADQPALQNWIANLFNLTKVDAPVFAAGRGFTGDASNDALSTGFTPSTASGKFTLDDATLGVLILGPANASGIKVDAGAQGGAGSTFVGANGATGPLLAANSAAGIIPSEITGTLMLGLWTVVRRSSSTVEVFCGKLSLGTISSTSNALPTGVLRYLASTSSFFSNRLLSHAYAGQALTSGEMTTMANAIHADAKSTGAYLKRAAIVCDGNSLTVGYNAQTPYTTVLQSAYDTAGYAANVINTGISGQTTQEMTGLLATSNLRRAASQYPADKRIVVGWEIRNDIALNAITATQAVDNMQSYCVAARALGYDKIIVCNTIADGSGNANFTPAARAAVNSELAARYSTFADYLVDLYADPRLQDPNDTTYYAADKLHLVSTGYAVVESLIKPVVDAALAAIS